MSITTPTDQQFEALFKDLSKAVPEIAGLNEAVSVSLALAGFFNPGSNSLSTKINAFFESFSQSHKLSVMQMAFMTKVLIAHHPKQDDIKATEKPKSKIPEKTSSSHLETKENKASIIAPKVPTAPFKKAIPSAFTQALSLSLSDSKTKTVEKSDHTPHLAFFAPKVSKTDLMHVKLLTDLLKAEPAPPSEVAIWLNARIAIHQKNIDDATKAAHAENAQLLAQFVILKFNKYAAKRFGETDETRLCFYNGEPRVNSEDQEIVLDPVFASKVRELAGTDSGKIIGNLHIGANSLKRFQQFITLKSL